jgi:hypothetical protein
VVVFAGVTGVALGAMSPAVWAHGRGKSIVEPICLTSDPKSELTSCGITQVSRRVMRPIAMIFGMMDVKAFAMLFNFSP